MCISKHLLMILCVVMPSLVLNAMPSARPVAWVAPAVVTEIKRALKSNMPNLVLQLLRDNGLGVNSQLTDKRETALHLAAKLGMQQVAETLLGHGAKVNMRDDKGRSPLAYAQKRRHTQLTKLLQNYAQAELSLLQKEKTSEAQDLFAAAESNDRAGVELLLSEGANPREKRHHGKTAYNKLGFKTPFHIALEAGHYSLAAFLLKEANGINGLDERGWTPLMFAIVADDWELVRELIVDGANIFAGYHRSSTIQNALDVAQTMESEAQLVDIFVEEKGVDGVVHIYGETFPLIVLASEGKYTETVKLLREQGAEFDSEKVLLLAMLRRNWQRVLTLIEDETKLIEVFIAAKGVDKKIEGEDTLLILAARGGHTKVVELLVANNADVNIMGKDDKTALMEAVKNGHTETAAVLFDIFWNRVRKLIKDDKDIFHSGHQVLRVVRITRSEAQLVDVLVEGGVRSVHRALKFANQKLRTRFDREVNAKFLKLMREKLSEMLQPQDEKTTEPMAQDLLQAVTNNDRASVEHLLAKGANAQEKNAAGKTAIDVAISANHYVLAAILLRAAKGINGRDEKGWTPLSWAVVSGNENLVQDLLKDGANPSELSHDAIEIAMRVKKKEILALMVGMGTKDIFDYFGRALRGIIYDGDLQQLKMLLETGVDPSVATVRGKIDPLHGYNSSHGTLLHMAADVSWQVAKADYVEGKKVGGGRKAIMEYLLTNTAIDINALDGDGRTALQVVVDNYDNDNGISVFDALMAKHYELIAAGERGIDIVNRDSKGKTALDIASDSYEEKHFVTDLSRAVADLKVRNQ